MINKCKICGKEEKDEEEIIVYHRGCRFGKLFERDKELENKIGIKKGDGIMILDITKPKTSKKQSKGKEKSNG